MEKTLLTPEKYLGEKRIQVPETFFLFFHDAPILREIRQKSEEVKVPGIPGCHYVYQGKGFRKMLMGSDMSAFLLELLIACGMKKAHLFGTACLIADDGDVDSLHMIDMAICEEGVSKHYGNEDRLIAPVNNLNCAMHNLAEGCGVKVSQAISATTSAVFRETEEKVGDWKEEGATVIEMEAASLFAVANHRNIGIGYVTSISDRMTQTGWERIAPKFEEETTLIRKLLGE